MPELTAREHLIVQEVNAYAKRLSVRLRPTFVVGGVPASAGALSGNAVIVISPEMLDPTKFTDNDVRFILAHEIGHITRLDAYRFWTRWTDHASEARELDADRIAVTLVGCEAMKETVAHHWNEFMLGYQEEGNHHPHPSARLRYACPEAGLVQKHPGPIDDERKQVAGRSLTKPADVLPQVLNVRNGGSHVVRVGAMAESEGGPELPDLVIAGLGTGNAIGEGPLTFKLEGMPTLDLGKDSDGQISGPLAQRLTLKPYWAFNAAENSFTISGSKLRALVANLPEGELEVSVNFVSADGAFAAIYQFLAHGSSGSHGTRDHRLSRAKVTRRPPLLVMRNPKGDSEDRWRSTFARESAGLCVVDLSRRYLQARLD